MFVMLRQTQLYQKIPSQLVKGNACMPLNGLEFIKPCQPCHVIKCKIVDILTHHWPNKFVYIWEHDPYENKSLSLI